MMRAGFLAVVSMLMLSACDYRYGAGGLPAVEIAITANGQPISDNEGVSVLYWQDARGVDLRRPDGFVSLPSSFTKSGRTVARIANCTMIDGVCKASPSTAIELLETGKSEQALEVWRSTTRVGVARWSGPGHPKSIRVACAITSAEMPGALTVCQIDAVGAITQLAP